MRSEGTTKAPPGPASAAGIHKDDIIEKIDGKPASEYKLDQLHEMFKYGGHHSLGIKRGEEKLQVTLALKKEI